VKKKLDQLWNASFCLFEVVEAEAVGPESEEDLQV
jgi:hypothetical protein